jgi:hypothetical protein
MRRTDNDEIGYERPLPETLPTPPVVSNSMISNKAILHFPVEIDSLYTDKGYWPYAIVELPNGGDPRSHTRFYRQRSRRLLRGSVAVRERSGSYESHVLRGARLRLKTNPRPSNRRLLRIPSHCLLQAQSRAEDKSRRSEDHTVRSLDLLTPDSVEWTSKHWRRPRQTANKKMERAET